MKSILFSIILILLSYHLSAQVKANVSKIDSSLVPTAVRDNYNSNIGFPVKNWLKRESTVGQKKNILYVADFEAQMLPTRSRYQEDGTQVSYSVYYKPNELDAPIQEAALKANKGFTIQRGERLAINKIDKTYYRIVLRKGAGQKTIFWCDLEGKPLEKSQIPTNPIDDAEDK